MSFGDFTQAAEAAAEAAKNNRIYRYPLDNRYQYRGTMTFYVVDEEAERAFNPDFSGTGSALLSAGGDFVGTASDVFASAVVGTNASNFTDEETGGAVEASRRAFYGEGNVQKAKVTKEPKLLTDRRVTLHLPQAIQIQDGVSYNTAFELGVIGGGVESALLSNQNVGESVVKSVSSVNNMIRELARGNYSAISREEASLAAQRVARNIPRIGTEATAGIASATGVTTNPNVRTIFQSVPIRNFSFSFNLVPTSKDEAQQIRDIVKFFRSELYPTQLDAGGVAYGYKFPNRFVIKVRYNLRDMPGVKFLPVYLQSFVATYNPNGMGMHKDGYFSEVQISMNFTESKALNKQEVEEGGY